MFLHFEFMCMVHLMCLVHVMGFTNVIIHVVDLLELLYCDHKQQKQRQQQARARCSAIMGLLIRSGPRNTRELESRNQIKRYLQHPNRLKVFA